MSKASKKSSVVDLSGLDEVMTGQAAEHASNYQLIEIERIHPDPQQPRSEMDLVALDELAQSMSVLDAAGKPRGVRQPISVRPDPDNDGQYLINYGHRRHRAAGIAKLATIPAIIQGDSTFTDQLLENIQREDLGADDIAQAIERLMTDEGMTLKQVGDALGKPKDWVSLHSQFGRAGADIKALFDKGIVAAVRGAVELERARAKHPEKITQLIERLVKREQPIGRRELIAEIASVAEVSNPMSTPSGESQGQSGATPPESDDTPKDEQRPTRPPAKPSSAAQPPTGAAKGGAASSEQSEISNDDKEEDYGDAAEPEQEATTPLDVRPPAATRNSGVCITVQWMEGDESMYGQLLQEAQADDRSVAIYGDDGERRTLPISEVRMVALTEA